MNDFAKAPQPYKVLSPLDALMEAAKLNREALDLLANLNPTDGAATAADNEAMRTGASLAQSLSTYALAMYAREGWGP